MEFLILCIQYLNIYYDNIKLLFAKALHFLKIILKCNFCSNLCSHRPFISNSLWVKGCESFAFCMFYSLHPLFLWAFVQQSDLCILFYKYLRKCCFSDSFPVADQFCLRTARCLFYDSLQMVPIMKKCPFFLYFIFQHGLFLLKCCKALQRGFY